LIATTLCTQIYRTLLQYEVVPNEGFSGDGRFQYGIENNLVQKLCNWEIIEAEFYKRGDVKLMNCKSWLHCEIGSLVRANML
jgi:hypothetical protein